MALDRIEAVNPIVNAVVELRAEEDMQEAAAVDEATRP
jgi:Asp-tRNA(Asn)/Glu-tRNA(Gln) amidotransferase A subunit family amidase